MVDSGIRTMLQNDILQRKHCGFENDCIVSYIIVMDLCMDFSFGYVMNLVGKIDSEGRNQSCIINISNPALVTDRNQNRILTNIRKVQVQQGRRWPRINQSSGGIALHQELVEWIVGFICRCIGMG